jgi:hypothetical protein
MSRLSLPGFLVILIIIAFGCKKDPVVFENNEIPPYDEVPTIKVQNYVNRLFIDILGREPVDIEMDAEVLVLEANDLSFPTRELLIEKLMFNTDFVEGDISYNHAYYHKVYEDTKARMIEGASDGLINETLNIYRFAAISDSLDGNLEGYERNMAEVNKLQVIIDSREEYRLSEIPQDEMYRRMMNNAIYDEINMNSFNFINATFNDLYYRFPTTAEFDNAFEIIEFNNAAVIFGEVAQNKGEYLQVLTSTDEYFEGLITWAYLSLLAREPSSLEVFETIDLLSVNEDFQSVQKLIMKGDEYAGFD